MKTRSLSVLIESLTPEAQRTFARERAHDLQMLKEVKAPLEIATLPLYVAARTDPRAGRIARDARVACHSGCSWCCHGTRVEVTPPEAIAVAELLRVRSEPEAQQGLGEALRAAAAERRRLTPRQHFQAHTPCHFLDPASGACTIYEARPLGCRSLTSVDSAACKAAYNGEPVRVPRPGAVDSVYDVARLALHAACTDARLDMRVFELTNAVAVAFSEPNAALRWHAGERVFDAVRPNAED